MEYLTLITNCQEKYLEVSVGKRHETGESCMTRSFLIISSNMCAYYS